jgi:adenosylcobinamide kinase/adenosylcobinamide-phosphate guanylyltransferase
MITFVLGGARSGKSEFAEQRAAAAPAPITYVATAVLDGDAGMDARVARHRSRRPPEWRTVEAGADLVAALRDLDSDASVLVDSLGTWVASQPGFEADAEGLCAALAARGGLTVVVSEEVGLGVHPSTEVGGRFRDALGAVNRAVAAVAGEMYLVVAGRALDLSGAAIVDPR